MDLRLFMLVFLCIYTEVSTFPSNIETNQIGDDGNREVDPTSVILESVGQVDESVTPYQEDDEESSSSTGGNTTDSPSTSESSTSVVEEKHVKKNASATPITHTVEYKLIYVPYRSPVPNPNVQSIASSRSFMPMPFPGMLPPGISYESIPAPPGMTFPGMPPPGISFESIPAPPGMTFPGMPPPGISFESIPAPPGMTFPGMPTPGISFESMPAPPGMTFPGMPTPGISFESMPPPGVSFQVMPPQGMPTQGLPQMMMSMSKSNHATPLNEDMSSSTVSPKQLE